MIDGVGIWAIHNHGLVHITAILELFVVVGEAYIFYLWMCILVFYAVEKRHADVGQILLSYPYSRVKIGFPKIPLTLGKPFKSGLAAMLFNKWCVLQMAIVKAALETAMCIWVWNNKHCVKEPLYMKYDLPNYSMFESSNCF